MLRHFIIWTFCVVCVPVFSQTLPKVKLTDTLLLFSSINAAKQSDAVKKLYERQTSQLRNDGLLFNAVNIKSKAPDFTVKSAKGKVVQLASEIQNGPVVILWIQGSWNPYCNIALRYFQAYHAEFKKYGAQLMALTPENLEKIALCKAHNKITFDIFQDKDNAIAKQYGIVYTTNDTLKNALETQYQISKFIGEKQSELPLPAAYIVAPNGKVAFAFLDTDHQKRAEPTDFLRVLRGMGFPERK